MIPIWAFPRPPKPKVSRLWIILILAGFLAFYMIGRGGRGRPTTDTQIIHDTTTVFVPMRGDTTIKWLDKIRYREVKPKTITIYRYDTTKVYVLPKEMIVDLDYDGDLIFRTVALKKDSTATFKRYFYPNVGSVFSVRPKHKGAWFVKAKKQFFSRKDLILGYSWADGAFLQGNLGVSRIIVTGEVSAKGLEVKADLRVGYRFLGQ